MATHQKAICLKFPGKLWDSALSFLYVPTYPLIYRGLIKNKKPK